MVRRKLSRPRAAHADRQPAGNSTGFIPRALGAWGVFASLLYAAAWLIGLVLPQSSLVTHAPAPILVAELSTALWLLIAGIRTSPAAAPALGTS